jgi:peroxiredoxin
MSKSEVESNERDALSPTGISEPRPATDTSSKKIIWIFSLALLFVLVFCAGFAFFYTRNHQNALAIGPVGSGKSLPSAELVDESNQLLADSELRKGRFVLVFVTSDCDACRKESEFLKDLVGKRSDVTFYGVISFGDMDSSFREAKGKFPFKVFYDRGFHLAAQLGIKRVPIKIFVENGVIKKSWGGATMDDKAKADFVQWLSDV